MKKQIILSSFLAFATICFGQTTPWNVSGTNIFNPNTGNVKVGGVMVPKQKLDVQGNIAISGGAGQLVYDGPDGYMNWGHAASGDMRFRVMNFQGNLTQGVVERMIIQGATGNVGIGITNPSQRIDVDGNVSIRGGHTIFNSQTGVIDWGASGTGDLIFRTLSIQGDIWSYTDRIKIKNNGWINIGGNVGNNSVDPSDQVHVFPTSSGSGITITQNNAGNSAVTLHNANGSGKSYSLRSTNTGNFSIYDNNNSAERLTINNIGNVKIVGKLQVGSNTQTTGPHTDAMLTIGGTTGKLVAKQIYVTASNWADFVFANDYNLRKLSDVEEYYKTNKHLPEIPSAKEVEENGVSVGEMNKLLLQKIEELTIYVVEQQKQIDELKARKK